MRPSHVKCVVLGILKETIIPMKRKQGVRTGGKSLDAGHRIRAPETNPVTKGGTMTRRGRPTRKARHARKALSHDHARRLAAARGLIDAPASKNTDIPAFKRTEQELEHAWNYAHAIIEAAPPLLVLDQKLRVRTANESFCTAFQISPGQTLNRRVYELGNGQWNIPRLRTLLEEVLPRKSVFKDFEVTHEFESIGPRTMLLSGRQVDNLQRILLVIDDITEQVQSQAGTRASEIRYRRLFEAARDGILILDPDARKITDANPFMTELLGYSHKELLGKELWEIGLLKDEQASRAAFHELREKRFIRYEDLPLRSKKGKHHEVEFVSNLYDEDGKYVIQCNIRDITARKRVEQELSEKARLLDLTNDAIIVRGLDDRISLWNKGAEKLYGWTCEEVIGKHLHSLLHTEYPQPMEAIVAQLYGEGQFSGEVVQIARNGRRVPSLCRWVMDGSTQSILTSYTDISEHTKMASELREAHAQLADRAVHLEKAVTERTTQLRETIGELEAFSYSVSHDMRAPLRAMQTFASYLVEEYGGKLDEPGIDYLHQIMRSAVRLDHLIQDVLSYTKILHAKLPMEPVDMDRLVRDIVEAFPNGQPIRPQIEIKGTLPMVMGNEALLAQCVTNLLSNAAKFVSCGTTPQMEVSAEAVEDTFVRVWFRDNGVGIAPENHTRIFRLFERIHLATEYEGTGIGLTIVRKAIERMGAQVGLESALGKGSNFWIQLKKG
jgi:PAS domain S-box-containing protein